jgi:hypothetical protein
MRFYAVSTAAIDHTHRSLQSLPQCRGGHGPSRALRVAQLYGHLQCRADGDGQVVLRLRELAASWHLQPHMLRADLQDLQHLGWLRYTGRPDGTWIQVHRQPIDSSNPEVPIAQATDAAEATGTTGSVPAGSSSTATGSSSSGSSALLAAFVEHYNRHRPSSWPAYTPRSSSLVPRLQRAIHHAGGAEPFWQLLQRALHAMPPFWRDTYPQGRSGGECVATLLSTSRQGVGLGVEFWHLFSWSSATGGFGAGATEGAAGAGGSAGGGTAEGESELQRARMLFAWDGHHWRGQGSAVLHLTQGEKLRLALLLEAAGYGEPGAAVAQYGPVEA